MRWTMRERWVLGKSLAARYQKSGKKEKSQLLKEFIEMTGYNRVYGAYLLGQEGREIRLSPKVVAVAVRTRTSSRLVPPAYWLSVRQRTTRPRTPPTPTGPTK